MVSGRWEGSGDIYASGDTIETVEDLCYLGSYISTTGNCDQDTSVRIGKVADVFSKLDKLWKNKKISLSVKTRLYEALVLSMLLNSAELWPVWVTQMKKKLDAAHHRWQRSMLGISWKDKVTNEKVREATALPKLEVIIRCRRLRWVGHLSRTDHLRLPRQALIWESEGFRRRPGRPRQNWKDVVKKNLKKMGISWDEVEEAAEDRRSWRYCVAQCVFDAGWIRNQVWLKKLEWCPYEIVNKCNVTQQRVS